MSATQPLSLPKDVFDGLQAQLATGRAQSHRNLPVGLFKAKSGRRE